MIPPTARFDGVLQSCGQDRLLLSLDGPFDNPLSLKEKMVDQPVMQPQIAVSRKRRDSTGAPAGRGASIYLPAGQGKGESSNRGSRDTALS
jgi:hypothetical protein